MEQTHGAIPPADTVLVRTAEPGAVGGAEVMTEDKLLNDDDDPNLSDLTKLRKRRTMEGAETSHDEFGKAFDEWHSATAQGIQQHRDEYNDVDAWGGHRS